MRKNEPTTTEALAVSPEEAAHLIGIGRTQFFRLLRERKLAARKIGRRTLILRSDLEVFLKTLPEQAG